MCVMQDRAGVIKQQTQKMMMLMKDMGLSLVEAKAQVSEALPLPELKTVEEDDCERKERAQQPQQERQDL